MSGLALLEIVDKSLNITRDNIIGMRGKFPYNEARQDGGRSSTLYLGKIIGITDDNRYKINFDDGDRGTVSFEDAKKSIIKSESDSIFMFNTQDKSNMGRIKGKITAKSVLCKKYCYCGNISKKIFLEDNKTSYNFIKSCEITYNFEDIPNISHLNITFGEKVKNVKVSILKIMDKKTRLLENINITNIKEDSNIDCDCNVKWIKIVVQSSTDIKNIKVFFNPIKNSIIEDYDNIYNIKNPIMIPSNNVDFCDLYITHKEIKSESLEDANLYIPIEKHFLKVFGKDNPLLGAYNFAINSKQLYKGKPYIRLLCSKNVLPVIVNLMLGKFKKTSNIKHIIEAYKIAKEYMIDIIINKIENIVANLKVSQLIKLYSKELNKNNTKKLYYIIVKNIKEKITKSKLESILIDNYENKKTNPDITTLLLEIMVMRKI
jgi:hypothetical protein